MKSINTIGLFLILVLLNCKKTEKPTLQCFNENVDSLYICFSKHFEVNYQLDRKNFVYPFTHVKDLQTQFDLIKKLRVTGFEEYSDIKKYGEGGGAYLHFVYWELISSLITNDKQGDLVVNLWDDECFGWDAGYSLLLADLIVKEGNRMLPIVRRFETRKSSQETVIKLIEEGASTAI